MPINVPVEKPAVLFFKSPGCANCRRLTPLFQEAIPPYENRVVVQVVDITAESETAVTHGVMSVPVLIFFRNGREVSRLAGLVPRDRIVKSLEAITT